MMLHITNNPNPRDFQGSANDTNLDIFAAYSIQNPFLKEYQKHLDDVMGWFTVGDLKMLDWVSQREINTEGGILELGVHLGKMFIPLNMTVNEGTSYAVDIFGKLQDYNVSHSGGDCLNQAMGFRNNVEKYDKRWSGFNVQIINEDTMMLDPSHFEGNKFKIISIDAGHHRPHVLNDLYLAEKLVTRDGVVIVDDWFCNGWPGVTEGTIEYLSRGEGLVPFASYQNKLYLCRYGAHYKWMYEMKHFKYKRLPTKLCGTEMYDICEHTH